MRTWCARKGKEKDEVKERNLQRVYIREERGRRVRGKGKDVGKLLVVQYGMKGTEGSGTAYPAGVFPLLFSACVCARFFLLDAACC